MQSASQQPTFLKGTRMKYLKRVAETADHIKECADFLADQASSDGTYELEDAGARELVRDLLHTITVDAQQMSLLMEVEAEPVPLARGSPLPVCGEPIHPTGRGPWPSGSEMEITELGTCERGAPITNVTVWK